MRSYNFTREQLASFVYPPQPTTPLVPAVNYILVEPHTRVPIIHIRSADERHTQLRIWIAGTMVSSRPQRPVTLCTSTTRLARSRAGASSCSTPSRYFRFRSLAPSRLAAWAAFYVGIFHIFRSVCLDGRRVFRSIFLLQLRLSPATPLSAPTTVVTATGLFTRSREFAEGTRDAAGEHGLPCTTAHPFRSLRAIRCRAAEISR